jgi:hypothetical protein
MEDRGSAIQERALALSARLAESHEAYTALLALEREQNRLIEDSDLDGAAAKIEEKNALIARIQEKDRLLHAENEGWQPYREEAPNPLRDRLREQVDSLGAVMTQLLQIQSENEEKLNAHGDVLSAKLVELQKKKSAHKGYQQRMAGDAYQSAKFYDKNS